MADPSYLTGAISSIDDIKENAEIRDAFSSFFVGNAGRLYNWNKLDGATKDRLNRLLEFKTVDPASTYRGHYIGLCSIFELFCKNMIENIIRRKVEETEKFDELDRKISAANFHHTGLYFTKNRDQYLNGERQNFEGLSSNLTSCTIGSTSYEINTELMTKNLGNCTPAKLESKFEELGLVSPFIDDLGRNKGLQKWAGSTGTRVTTKTAKDTLKKTIHRRHAITHPDGSSNTVVVDDIKTTVEFFLLLMPALADHAENC